MITLAVNGYFMPIEFSTFPGGEEYVRFSHMGQMAITPSIVSVRALVRSSSDLMRLALLKNAIDVKLPGVTTTLELPYMPYARQDRVFAKGESHSLKVAANFINSMGFNEVIIDDPHSYVTEALVDNITVRSQLQCMTSSGSVNNLLVKADFLIAPDAGAQKKVNEIARHYNKPVLQLLKERQPNSDSITITGTEQLASEKFLGKLGVVVDDICDGGGTFIALAEAIDGRCKLGLAVTHGIFSKGCDPLNKYYTYIRCVHDWVEECKIIL